jgi:hypothetical protein
MLIPLALAADPKKSKDKAKPLMAQPKLQGLGPATPTNKLVAPPGVTPDGLLNTGTGKMTRPDGGRLVRHEVTLDDGMTLHIDADRQMSQQELQDAVDNLSQAPAYKKAVSAIQQQRAAAAKVPTSQLGPMDNEQVARHYQDRYEQMMGPNGLAIAQKMTPAQIADLPIEVRRSLQSRMMGDVSARNQQDINAVGQIAPRVSEYLGMAAQDIIDPNVLKPNDYSLQNGLKPQAKKNLNPAARVYEAGVNAGSYFLPYVGQLRGTMDTALMAQRITNGEGAQVAKETLDGLNVFDPKIDPIERGTRAINVLATIYGGYHAAQGVVKGVRILDVSKQLGVSKTEALKIVNWAEEASQSGPARTGIKVPGRDDAKGTAANIALGNYEQPVQGTRGVSTRNLPTTPVKPELKPAEPLNIPGKQGPQPATFGTAEGAPVAGRRMPTRAIPVEEPARPKLDPATEKLLARAEAIRAKNDFEKATAARKETQRPTLALPGGAPEPAPVATKTIPNARYNMKPVEKSPKPVAAPTETPAPVSGIDVGPKLPPLEIKRVTDAQLASALADYEAAGHVVGKKNAKGMVMVDGRGMTPEKAVATIRRNLTNRTPKAETPAPKQEPAGQVAPKVASPKRVAAAKGAKADRNGLFPQEKAEILSQLDNAKANPPEENMRQFVKPVEVKTSTGLTYTLHSLEQINKLYEVVSKEKSVRILSPKFEKPLPQSPGLTASQFVRLYGNNVEKALEVARKTDPNNTNLIDGLTNIQIQGELGNRVTEYSRYRNTSSEKFVADSDTPFDTEIDRLQSNGTNPERLAELKDRAERWTKLDTAYEQAASRRKSGGTGNKNRQRGATENPAQVIADYTVIAAYHIRNGARTAREVLNKMVQDHPYDAELIRSNLAQIINDAKGMVPEKPYRIKENGGVIGPKRQSKHTEAKAEPAPVEISPNISTKPEAPKFNAEKPVTAESVGVKSSTPKGTPTPNEKTNLKESQPVREVQSGQGTVQGKQPQGQGNGQKANAVVPEKEEVKYAASNAASNDIRARLGIDALPEAGKRSWDTVLSKATGSYDADKIDARVKDTKRVLNDVETAQVALRSAELEKKLKTATGDQYDELEKKLLEHTVAAKNAGTEQGRALAARNMAVLEDYSLAGMYRRYAGAAKVKSAEDFSPDVRAKIKELADSHEKLTQQIAGLQTKFDEQAARLAESERNRIAAEVASKGERKASTRATREDLVARIKKKQSQYVSSVPVQGLIDAADDIKALVRLSIQDGKTDLDEIYRDISAQLKPAGVDLTRGEFDGVMAGAYRQTPGIRKDLTQYQQLIKEARESGAGKDALIYQRIRALDERIKNYQYDNLKTTGIGKALTDAEIALKAKQVEFDRLRTQAKVKAEYDAMSPAGKVAHSAVEFANAIRSVVASTDVSAPLNQGLFYTLSHPGKSASAVWETMGALKGDEALNHIMGKIRNNRYYDLAKGSKLQVGAAAGDYADDFMTFGDSKAASILTGKYSPIGASERIYKAYVTKIRMDMFADLAKAEERRAGGRMSRADYEAIAEFVNTVTGTTTNKYVQAIAKPAGTIAFAPKYTVSRVKMAFATPAINAARVGNYHLAGKILGEYAKVAAAIGTGVYIANKNGANVEMDPRKPGFMKGQIGNVQFDAAQGLGQTYKLVAAILNPGLKQIPGVPPVDGKEAPARGALESYFMGKLAPAPRTALNVINKQAYGKSYDVKTQEGWKNLGLSLLPISVQDGATLAERKDISDEQKAFIGLAGFLGVKVDSSVPRAK